MTRQAIGDIVPKTIVCFLISTSAILSVISQPALSQDKSKKGSPKPQTRQFVSPDTFEISIINAETSAAVPDVELYLYFVDQKMREQVFVQKRLSNMNGKITFADLQSKYKTDGFDKFFVFAFKKKGFGSMSLRVRNFRSYLNNPKNWTVKLTKSVTLTGVVKNDNDEPIEGASVTSERFLLSPVKEFSVQSDKEGKFIKTDATPFARRETVHPDGRKSSRESTIYEVFHPEYGHRMIHVKAIPGNVSVFMRRVVRVSGKVTDSNGNAMRNALVHVAPTWDRELSRDPAYRERRLSAVQESVITDGNGHFQISLVADIRYNLWVNHQKLGAKAIEVGGKPGEKMKTDTLVLRPMIKVRGYIVDRNTGERITPGDSRVSFRWYGEDRPKNSAPVRSATINKDGSFSALMVPGTNFPYVSTYDSNGIHWHCDEYQVDGVQIKAGKEIELKMNVTRTKKR